MAGQVIDFWFTMGSTYTYFTVMRIERAVEEAGISLRWRPFRNLGALTGATQGVFLEGTAKTRYMLRDLERRAGKYCLPVAFRCPTPFRMHNVPTEWHLSGRAKAGGPRTCARPTASGLSMVSRMAEMKIYAPRLRRPAKARMLIVF